MNYPLKVKEIEQCLPHRPPLRWVDEVVCVKLLPNGGADAHCRLKLDKQAHYFNSKGRFRPTAFIEMMAQAYGFGRACLYLEKGENIRRPATYIVSIQGGKTSMDHLLFEGHEVLDIFARAERVLGEFTSVGGEVRLQNQNKVLASTKVRIFFETSNGHKNE